MRAARGFTLVELLISVAILGILGGVNAAVLAAGFDAWTHVQTRLDLQQVTEEVMDVVLEGGFDEEGLRDAVLLTQAETNAIGFVPLWTDRSHRPNSLQNKQQRFTLEKQFRSGAQVPIGQVREGGGDEWVTVPIRFEYGGGQYKNHPDDVVTFTDPISLGSDLRILYTPDERVHPETVMRFWYDTERGQVYRSYAGVTKRIPKRARGVRVERLGFLYYDNLNRPLPAHRSYAPDQMRRITGVKLYLALSRGRERKERTSFTNVRNVQTTGVSISKGSVLPLPSPEAVRAFSLGDLSGLKRPAKIELEVGDKARIRWKAVLEFKPVESESQVLFHKFRMESPPGTLRTSGIVDQVIARNEFVDLLGLDRTGMFDYDDDADIADAVPSPGSSNVVRVGECEFDAASLFIRP